MSEAASSRAVVAGGESSAVRRSQGRDTATAPGRGAEAGLGIGLGHVRVHRGSSVPLAARQ